MEPPIQPTATQSLVHAKETSNQSPVPEMSGTTRRGFLRFPRSWKEVKALGWKFVLGFIIFYLIRDTLLYIVLPYLLYKGIISL